MSLYARVKSLYRLLPEGTRRWVVERAPGPMRELRYRVASRLERAAPPEEVYDAYYFEHDVDPLMHASAEAIAGSIVRELGPETVVDVGCGTGGLLLALEGRGVRGLGFDRAEAALERCRERGLTVRRLDLTSDPIPPERVDLVVSTEVAEHLPEPSADRFVELLTTLAPAVVVTAALPGSRGKDHVNEQPNEYWIAKFADRGHALDRELTQRLRGEWESNGVHETFFRSLMVFRGEKTRGPSRAPSSS